MIPKDYGADSEKNPIIGGGSTHLTKYYQQTWKRGEELKEVKGTVGRWSGVQIFSLTDTVNWPGNVNSCLKLGQGTDSDERAGKDVWGLRLQLKCEATWQETTLAVSGAIQEQWTTEKILILVAKVKKPAQTTEDAWPPANGLIDQTWDVEMPMSKKAVNVEILAWGIMQPDKAHYNEHVVPETTTSTITTVEPTLGTTTGGGTYRTDRVWAEHKTYLDFDIDLKGSLFRYGSAVDTYPRRNDIQLLPVKINAGAAVALKSTGDCLDVQRVYSWSQEPPKRLWTTDAERFKRVGNAGFIDPDIEGGEKRRKL